MPIGKTLARWMHGERIAHIENMHDDHWSFASVQNLPPHTLRIVVKHMPETREPGQYTHPLNTIV